MSDEPISAPPVRNRGWLWFFVAVATLTVVAIIIIVWHGRQQLGEQITLEKLAEAEALWNQKGPRDYRLSYSITRPRGGETTVTDSYVVEVRDAKITSVLFNNKPIILKPDGEIFYDMPGLFRDIRGFLAKDAKPKPDDPRTFSRADFDPTDGHLRQFRRIVFGARERQEINVEELTPLK